MKAHPLLTAVDQTLAASSPIAWDALLERVLSHFACPVGTVHLLDEASGMLKIAAQRGLPPPVIDKVGTIPIGKGMAGIAAERREPVQFCNLQNDGSGVAKPGAKLTKMEGSIAVPMLDGKRLAGVLGIAKPIEDQFGAEETALLSAIGARIAQHLSAR